MTAADADRHLTQVARGGLIGLVGAVVSGIGGFGVVVLVARGFTPTDAGLFFSTTAVFLVLVAVSTLGTEAGFGRFLLRYEAQGRAGVVRDAVRAGCVPAMATALGLMLVGFVAAAAAPALGIGTSTAHVLVVLSLTLPFAVATDLSLSVIRAFGRIRSTVAVDRVLRAGLQVLATAVVVAVDGSLDALVAAWAACYVVAALVAVPLAARFLRRRLAHAPRAPRDPGVGRELWSFTSYRGVARVAQIAIQKADVAIVAAVISPSAAALYAAATRFVALGQIVTAALQQVVQPRYTAILLREEPDLLRDVHSTVRAWNILAVWPVYVTVAAAPLAYLALFGDAYADRNTWLVVALMGASMLVAVATGPVDTLLLMAGRSGLSLANVGAALAVDVVLCLALLPHLGIVGAAIAWACAVTLRCGLASLQVRRDLGVGLGGSDPALAGVVALLCLGIPGLLWSALGSERLVVWAALVMVGGITYAAVLWRLRHRFRLDLLARAWGPRSPGRRSPGLRGGRRLTTVVRRRMPAPVVRAMRAGAVLWGKATARWRLQPAFVVAGAQRAGTTTLFRLLADHPNLVRPTLDKGTGFFDDHYHRGSRWYRAHFPLAALARRRRGTRDVRTFECSGYYMFHPLAPGRLARELPDAKVVVVLRDPVDRAFSAHGHELRRGFEHESFVEAVAAEAERVRPEHQRLAVDEHYRSYAHRHFAYLGRGEYAGQVAALMDAVGPDRVYVLDADAFFADPHTEYRALQEWLGLPVHLPERVERWNAGNREPVPASWRRRLEEHFEPHDRALAELIGRTPSWRKVRTPS